MYRNNSADDVFRLENTVSDRSVYARVTQPGVATDTTYAVQEGGVISPIGASQWSQYTYVSLSFFLCGGWSHEYINMYLFLIIILMSFSSLFLTVMLLRGNLIGTMHPRVKQLGTIQLLPDRS